MLEKIYNAINDPKVTFFLFPTPKLQELCALNQHPYIQKLTPVVRQFLMEGKVLPVAKEDVLNFIEGKLSPQQHFLMSTGEVRVAGAVEVMANKVVKQNIQGSS